MEKYLKSFREVYSSNEENLEMALFSLRELGANQIDSLKVLKSELKLSLKKADELILNSNVWADNIDQTIDFRNIFADLLEGEDEIRKNNRERMD